MVEIFNFSIFGKEENEIEMSKYLIYKHKNSIFRMSASHREGYLDSHESEWESLQGVEFTSAPFLGHSDTKI